MDIGFLHSLIRKDEHLLLDEFHGRSNIDIIMLDDREINFIIGKKKQSQIALPLFRRFDLILISKLSPKRSNTNQAKPKKQHAGRFGNAISHI